MKEVKILNNFVVTFNVRLYKTRSRNTGIPLPLFSRHWNCIPVGRGVAVTGVGVFTMVTGVGAFVVTSRLGVVKVGGVVISSVGVVKDGVVAILRVGVAVIVGAITVITGS